MLEGRLDRGRESLDEPRKLWPQAVDAGAHPEPADSSVDHVGVPEYVVQIQAGNTSKYEGMTSRFLKNPCRHAATTSTDRIPHGA